ncbi:hypothetical protein FVE85_3794 [Porphyridium purpureum]|uniref:Uncharacterized protein n=1 Tax=Porphyridium purpureum TaxID=35688 RepID=A0A5J4YLP9_PORPP|nr:hypothetical protein FVE85_3794 [Porphyridium purpureum]|eukprot:POR7869..scf249_10
MGRYSAPSYLEQWRRDWRAAALRVLRARVGDSRLPSRNGWCIVVARLDVNVLPGIGAPRWTWLGIGQDALDAALHASSSAKGKGKDKDTSARAALSAVCEGSGEELLIRHVPDAHQYALRVPAGSHCVRISRAAHAETMLDRIVQEEPTRDGRGFIVHNGVLAVQFGNDSGLEAVFLPGDWEDNSLQPNQRKRYVSDISGEIHVAMQKEVADFQGSCRSGSAAVIQTKQWRVSGIQTSHETECTTVIITREAPSNVAPFLAHIVLQEHVVIPMAGTALQYKICVRNEAPSRAPTSVFALTAYGFVRPERQLFGKTKQHWVLDVERPNGTRCALVKDKVPIKYSEGRGQMLLHGEDEYKCPALGVCSLRFHCGPQHRNFYTTEMERWHLINNALRMSLVDLMSGSLPTVIRTGGESSIFGFWVACYSAGVDAFHTHQHAFLTSLRRPALPLSAAPLLWTFPSPQAAWINQAQVLQAIWTRSITNAHCLMLPCNDDARIVRIDDELSIYGRSCASLHVPLSCNFQRSPELRLNFSKAPGVSAGLFISKIGSDPGSRICLAEFSGNDSASDGVIEICLSTKTGWYAGSDTRKPFPKKNGTKEMRQVHANHAFALTFRADASASLESECELATIHQLVVGPPKLDAPRLVTPVNDANVTDVAVSYEIQNQTAVGHFT